MGRRDVSDDGRDLPAQDKVRWDVQEIVREHIRANVSMGDCLEALCDVTAQFAIAVQASSILSHPGQSRGHAFTQKQVTDMADELAERVRMGMAHADDAVKRSGGDPKRIYEHLRSADALFAPGFEGGPREGK